MMKLTKRWSVIARIVRADGKSEYVQDDFWTKTMAIDQILYYLNSWTKQHEVKDYDIITKFKRRPECEFKRLPVTITGEPVGSRGEYITYIQLMDLYECEKYFRNGKR